jgi:hypothetical protein
MIFGRCGVLLVGEELCEYGFLLRRTREDERELADRLIGWDGAGIVSGVCPRWVVIG